MKSRTCIRIVLFFLFVFCAGEQFVQPARATSFQSMKNDTPNRSRIHKAVDWIYFGVNYHPSLFDISKNREISLDGLIYRAKEDGVDRDYGVVSFYLDSWALLTKNELDDNVLRLDTMISAKYTNSVIIDDSIPPGAGEIADVFTRSDSRFLSEHFDMVRRNHGAGHWWKRFENDSVVILVGYTKAYDFDALDWFYRNNAEFSAADYQKFRLRIKFFSKVIFSVAEKEYKRRQQERFEKDKRKL